MRRKKGTATVKKARSKYFIVGSDSETAIDPASDSESENVPKKSDPVLSSQAENDVKPGPGAALQKLSSTPGASAGLQPRQDLVTPEQKKALENELFPSDANSSDQANDDSLPLPRTPLAVLPHRQSNSQSIKTSSIALPSLRPATPEVDSSPVRQTRTRGSAATSRKSKQQPESTPSRPAKKKGKKGTETRSRDSSTTLLENSAAASPLSSVPGTFIMANNSSNSIQGGAYIPPNQQRHMRACMVCSIVRTQQQFINNGCPNCEDILELIGNADQVNECTSQVFDGLISVADTTRSWVARYQRLEGYVPGVYATQVEGVLPEDVIVAVENAGINYVPRDGSEQEMLPKE